MNQVSKRLMALLLMAALLVGKVPPLAAFATNGGNGVRTEHDGADRYATPADAEKTAKEKPGAIVITAFAKLTGKAANRSFDPGEIATQADLDLPESLAASNDQDETVIIKGVSWVCTAIISEPEGAAVFDPNTPNIYEFTAVLPQSYILAEDVSMPVITVIIRSKIMALASRTVAITETQSETEIQTAIQTALNSAGSGETVTVTGSKTNASITLRLTIPADVTLLWEAAWQGTTSQHTPLMEIKGSGVLEIAGSGEIVQSGQEDALQSAAQNKVIVSGGTVSATTKRAISAKGDVEVQGGTAVVKVTGNNGYAISADGNVKMQDGTVSATTGYAISAKGNVEIQDGIVSATGRAISAADSVQVLGGTVSTSTGSAISAKGSIKVQGGTVSTATGSAIFSSGFNSRVTVSDTAVVTATGDNGKAISAGGSVEILGGTVSATTGSAIRGSSGSQVVTVSGGLVLSYGSSIASVISNSSFTGATGSGMVIAWDKDAGVTFYSAHSTSHIVKSPAAATAHWDISGSESGITYKNGSTQGFIPLPVTVSATPQTTLTKGDLAYSIPSSHIYTGSTQGIGSVTHAGSGTADAATGGIITVTYNGTATLPTDAGTYAVAAEISGGFLYTAATIGLGEYTIAKAPAPVIIWPTAAAITFGEPLSASSLTGGSTSYGSFAWEDGSVIPLITNSGYPVRFTPNAQTVKNYNITQATQTVPLTVRGSLTGLTYTPLDNQNAKVSGYTLNAMPANLTIPDKVLLEYPQNSGQYKEYQVTEIGEHAFSSCTSLTSVTIPDSVETIGNGAFSNCHTLTTFTVNSGNTFYTAEDGVLYNKDKTLIIQYPPAKSEAAFSIPPSVETIGAWAFAICPKLTSIAIPDSVKTIGDDAFRGCTILTSVTIPDSVETIGNGAFSECYALTTFTVNSGNAFYAAEDGVLYNKNKTLIIQYPPAKSEAAFSIPPSVETIGAWAFANCTKLTSIAIPASVKIIGNYAFLKCTSLADIATANSVKTIGTGAFGYCTGLTGITLPDSLEVIGARAFESCAGLTNISIPASVHEMEYQIFDNCSNLGEVAFSGSKPDPFGITSAGHLALFNGCVADLTLYVPANDNSWDGIEQFPNVAKVVRIPQQEEPGGSEGSEGGSEGSEGGSEGSEGGSEGSEGGSEGSEGGSEGSGGGSEGSEGGSEGSEGGSEGSEGGSEGSEGGSEGSEGGSGSSGGGSGGGGAGAGKSGAITVTAPKPNMPIPVTMTVTPTPDMNGVLSLTITAAQMQQLMTSGAREIQDHGKVSDGYTVRYAVNIPAGYSAGSLIIILEAEAAALLKDSQAKGLELNSALASVHFNRAAIDQIIAQTDDNVTITITPVIQLSAAARLLIGGRPAFNINLTSAKDGQAVAVTDFGSGSCTLKLAYTPAGDEAIGNLCMVYVDDSGVPQVLQNSSYIDGNVITSRSTVAVYGVGYQAPAQVFTDTASHWARDDIGFAVSRGLLGGTGDNTFSPDTAITRGMFMTALGRLSWQDVPGTEDSQLSPDQAITREDMAVMMQHYAQAAGFVLPVSREAVSFTDQSAISTEAADAVRKLNQAGIINGKTANCFDPKGKPPVPRPAPCCAALWK